MYSSAKWIWFWIHCKVYKRHTQCRSWLENNFAKKETCCNNHLFMTPKSPGHLSLILTVCGVQGEAVLVSLLITDCNWVCNNVTIWNNWVSVSVSSPASAGRLEMLLRPPQRRVEPRRPRTHTPARTGRLQATGHGQAFWRRDGGPVWPFLCTVKVKQKTPNWTKITIYLRYQQYNAHHGDRTSIARSSEIDIITNESSWNMYINQVIYSIAEMRSRTQACYVSDV